MGALGPARALGAPSGGGGQEVREPRPRGILLDLEFQGVLRVELTLDTPGHRLIPLGGRTLGLPPGGLHLLGQALPGQALPPGQARVLLVLQRPRQGLVGVEIPVTMNERFTGRSKIFSNWAKVFFYMVYSALLAISKRGTKKHPRQKVSASAGVHL